jgi:prevent-host-death family protein
MQTWQLQEAKARLSELVKLAASDGPQEITVHGKAAAVLVSVAEFAKLVGAQPATPSWLEIFQRAQLEDGELNFERDADATERDTGF